MRKLAWQLAICTQFDVCTYLMQKGKINHIFLFIQPSHFIDVLKGKHFVGVVFQIDGFANVFPCSLAAVRENALFIVVDRDRNCDEVILLLNDASWDPVMLLRADVNVRIRHGSCKSLNIMRDPVNRRERYGRAKM